MERSLYWFTKDLRINDNLALNISSQSDALLCVFVVDKRWFSPSNYQSIPLGIKRWQFLQACLVDLAQSLENLGQKLHVLYGETSSCLQSLCRAYDITDIIYTDLPGSYEQVIYNELKEKMLDINHHSIEQYTLFTRNILPFEQATFPISYSKFRKLIKHVSVPKPYKLSSRIPKQPTLKPSGDFTKIITSAKIKPNWLPIVNCMNDFLLTTPFKGGETAA